MIFHELNDDNFLFYAIKCYNDPQCDDVKEFYSDLKRFQYLKKLLIKYEKKGILKQNLILNHIVILCNVFGIEAGTRMLLFRIEKKHHGILKPFLQFLNYLNDDNEELSMRNVTSDTNIIKYLDEL